MDYLALFTLQQALYWQAAITSGRMLERVPAAAQAQIGTAQGREKFARGQESGGDWIELVQTVVYSYRPFKSVTRVNT